MKTFLVPMVPVSGSPQRLVQPPITVQQQIGGGRWCVQILTRVRKPRKITVCMADTEMEGWRKVAELGEELSTEAKRRLNSVLSDTPSDNEA